MRPQSIPQQYFDFSYLSSNKIVNEYRQKYEGVSAILDANPLLLTLVHRDWSELLSTSGKGRQATYTSENLLRALVVMFVEQESYRGVVTRIETSEFLRHFVRLEDKPMMGHTLLAQAYGVLSQETVEAMTEALTAYAVTQGKISGDKERIDSTVYQVNIHYPTDSSLLGDSFRTLARLVRCIQQELPGLNLKHRFHNRKIKKLCIFISRNASSQSQATQRQVKEAYRKLIDRVRWIHGVGQSVLAKVDQAGHSAPALSHYLPLVDRIVDQADRRVLQDQKVAADEKLYSLFEAHTELIKRGKAGKPVEFGHKVLLAQTGEKFIHHYQVQAHREEDKDLLVPALEAHKVVFDRYPDLVAADKGFYEDMDQIDALEADIKTVSIAKKGRRTEQEYDREHTDLFIKGQHFRAGIEGTISVLKRVFKLSCCFFKGFKNYAVSVGLGVLCHNLVLLTRL